MEPPFMEAGSATIDDFNRLGIRVARVLEAAPLEGARQPAYRLRLDFGPAGGGGGQSPGETHRRIPQ